MNNRRHFLGTCLASLGLASLPCVLSASPALNVGIIFVGASSCPYCRVVAPVLHDLQAQTGMDILVASIDNAPVYPFPEFQDGRAHPMARKVTHLPHVMVYNFAHARVTHEIVGLRSTRNFIQRLSAALRQSSEM